jgi:hypothetical protein
VSEPCGLKLYVEAGALLRWTREDLMIPRLSVLQIQFRFGQELDPGVHGLLPPLMQCRSFRGGVKLTDALPIARLRNLHSLRPYVRARLTFLRARRDGPKSTDMQETETSLLMTENGVASRPN